ncbi:MAG: bifunctional (p)ppGpp synthetase/guanosine-3',5'-bis(diphosphate) 3'-pyrophosphohydrolase [Candidatus Eremiobacteraeota bacterium]|nr:bifunctional (p)ppGpp synthetase/guanosine-3',5'-bis(diphosphate) 3'-pyrophosphohydrolase [Candidatus Eremiobacteraeota bacterium]
MPTPPLQELIAKVQSYDPTLEAEWLRAVYATADAAHGNQRRASGEGYIAHPLAVALSLAEMEMDRATIAAAILHDVVEDTSVTTEEVAERFGPEIAQLVEGVTKLTRIPYQSKEDAQVENLRKMFMAMAKDIRVIIIKLADRLHNMRTLYSLPVAKQQTIARETLEIYAPIAHRLGIWKIKWDLEDLALRYLDPEAYRDIAERVAKKREAREQAAAEVVALLHRQFQSLGIAAEVTGRPKHFYSIYTKMKTGRDFSTIYDLTAIRVIVETVKDCYATLGIVHSVWKPIPGRFKDYIAMPKPNMYQSLHTTVVGPGGDALEIQIRTREMHRTSEYGIAAHWRYKEGGKLDAFDHKLTWLRSLLEWQHDMSDSHAFMENLKLDLFENQVFIFSPKGDVYSLPAGATPLDFAYQVHTDVGNHCVGAKINGKIVPLDYQTKNGDICEVLVNKSARPSLDWLSIVRTSSAKHKIKQWFRKERKDENVVIGQEALERELARERMRPDLSRGEMIERIAKRMNYASAADLFAAIGFGDASAPSVVTRLRDENKASNLIDLAAMKRMPAPSRRPVRSSSGIRIADVDDVLVRLSKCCSPVPGDPIMGYVTIGKGVSVHRSDCPNVAYMSATPERILEASWSSVANNTHAVDVEVDALDRPGLLQDVMGVCAEYKTSASSVTARVKRDSALIGLTLQINDLAHLHRVLEKLRTLRDVRAVYRVTKREARASG